MRHALSIVLVLLFPAAAAAQWVIMSLESAVSDSDVIVVGTLRNVSEETKDEIDYGVGEIVVEEVLWGSAQAGQRLTLAWQNSSNIDCPRVEHRAHQDRQAIWLLTHKPEGGGVAADNPGRFVPLEKRGRVLELLRGRGDEYAGRDLKLEREALAQRGKIDGMLPPSARRKLEVVFRAFVGRLLSDKKPADLSKHVKEELGREFAGLSPRQTDMLTFYLLAGVLKLIPPHADEGDQSPSKEGIEGMSQTDLLMLQRMMEKKGQLETMISNLMKAGFEGGRAALQELKSS